MTSLDAEGEASQVFAETKAHQAHVGHLENQENQVRLDLQVQAQGDTSHRSTAPK